MLISDWSSDVCSSDLLQRRIGFDETLDFQGFATTHSRDIELFAALQGLYEQMVDERIDIARKHAEAEAFFIDLPGRGSHPGQMRSGERRVGKECVRTVSSRWSTANKKKNRKKT